VGFNKYGELGIGNTESQENFAPVIFKPNPIKIAQISAGQHVTLFIDINGKLYSCGINNLHGNSGTENQLFPLPVFS